MNDERYLTFPFGLNASAGVASTDLEGAIRGRIEQVLFTSPGERVMLPEFGSGVRDLVFQANNDVLAAATEFTIAKSLHATLGRLIMVNGVHVSNDNEKLMVEIIYTKNRDLERERVVFQLLPREGDNRG